jgi:hypothetical protein
MELDMNLPIAPGSPVLSASQRAASLLNAFPDLMMAALFFITWISPLALEERMVSYLVLVLLMEFIVIHSAGFMAMAMTSSKPALQRVGATIGLGLFYTLFVSAFAMSFDEWWPIAAFWGLVLNRLLSVFLGGTPAEEQRNAMMTTWGRNAAFYLFAVFLGIFLPLPELGITRDVQQLQAFSAGGLWTDTPETAIASGFIYFTAVAVTELFRIRLFQIPK